MKPRNAALLAILLTAAVALGSYFLFVGPATRLYWAGESGSWKAEAVITFRKNIFPEKYTLSIHMDYLGDASKIDGVKRISLGYESFFIGSRGSKYTPDEPVVALTAINNFFKNIEVSGEVLRAYDNGLPITLTLRLDDEPEIIIRLDPQKNEP